MKTLLAACGLLATVTLATPALAETPRTPAPEGASVYFIAPANGASVTGPVNVRFGLKGMGVAPAGTAVPATGHHHLLVDVAELPGLDAPLPATDNIRHFGKGQTETELTLPPGQHTLQLLLGDQNHVPHQPPVLSEKITITVK
ncbi:MAG: DUF4399 domain-containing protein [Pseudomonas sp.]|nr:DUF4399 domain-containing protein [Pseudomonas sp.]